MPKGSNCPVEGAWCARMPQEVRSEAGSRSRGRQKRGTEHADEVAECRSESMGAPCPVCAPVLRPTDPGCRSALAGQGRPQGCPAAPQKATLLGALLT